MENKNFTGTVICGLIGALLGILAGACVSICGAAVSGATGGTAGDGLASLGFVVIAVSIISLFTAIKSKKSKLFAIIMTVFGGIQFILVFVMGFSFMTLISAILIIVGGVLGIMGFNHK